MSWISNLLFSISNKLGGTSREEMEGISLDLTHPFWELNGESNFSLIFSQLEYLLPSGSILYFEGGYPTEDIDRFLQQESIPERVHLACGTLWPKPKSFHVPATQENLVVLSQLMRNHAEVNLAVHFHVYSGDEVVLQWHDAFDNPLLLSNRFSENQVKNFCEGTKMRYKQICL